MTGLRIIIPQLAHMDNFEENVAVTLRGMGHEVRTYPGPLLPRFDRRVSVPIQTILKKLGADHLTTLERWVVKEARAWRPHMVLCITQSLSEATLFQLKRAGVTYRLAWWGDHAATLHRLDLLSNEWDGIFIKDAATSRRMCGVGLNAFHLPEAMNPLWHVPVQTEVNDRVTIYGSWYGYRQVLADRLLRAGTKVDMYGAAPPLWSLPSVRTQHKRTYIMKAEKSRVLSAALAVVNSSGLVEGDMTNCRVFETAGCGGMQIAEYRPALAEFFEIGKEIMTFESLGELLEKIDFARQAPAEAQKIRVAGARRAHAEHTYALRLQAMFKKVGAA